MKILKLKDNEKLINISAIPLDKMNTLEINTNKITTFWVVFFMLYTPYNKKK